MDAKKVIDILDISRSTLNRYRQQNVLKATNLSNNRIDFDEFSVYLYKQIHRQNRITALYARVSTPQQMDNLDMQVQKLSAYAKQNNLQNIKVFRDVASGISFSDQTDFFKLLESVLDGDVEKVIVLSQDRLSQNNYQFLKSLFEKYNTKIVTLTSKADVGDSKEELPHELIDLFQNVSFFKNKE